MQRVNVVKRPPYAVEAIDHALQVLLMLQEQESMRISDIARRLGVAPSTVHRILSTLVYRGFAIQDEDRRYRLGAAVSPGSRPVDRLSVLLTPRLVELREATGETVSAMVREGALVRMLVTVESTKRLRVTDRTGTTMPMAAASVGKALLAHLPDTEIRRLYGGRQAKVSGVYLSEPALDALLEELVTVRATGIGHNERGTESDVSAIGCAIPSADRAPWLGLAVSVPAARAGSLRATELAELLKHVASLVASDLSHHGVHGPEQYTLGDPS